MRYRNDYIYYRECYSNKFFVTELRFQVKLYTGRTIFDQILHDQRAVSFTAIVFTAFQSNCIFIVFHDS